MRGIWRPTRNDVSRYINKSFLYISSSLSDDEFRKNVFAQAEKYFWIGWNEKRSVCEQLSQRKNYKPKNLRKILSDRKIIPGNQSLWNRLLDKNKLFT